MKNRVDAVKGFDEKIGGYDALPKEALAALEKVTKEASSIK